MWRGSSRLASRGLVGEFRYMNEEGDFKYRCWMCRNRVDIEEAMMHTPLCYRIKCQKLRVVPICTCNICRGTRTHPGDVIVVPEDKRKMREDGADKVMDIVSPPSKRPHPNGIRGSNIPPGDTPDNALCLTTTQVTPIREAPTTPIRDVTLIIGDKDILTREQLCASHCMICGNDKSPAQVNVPFIFVGRYKELMICKKGHLNTNMNIQHAESLVQRELDLEVSSLVPSSADVHHCEGYIDDVDDRACGVKKAMFLSIMDGKDEQYFCSASHLFRYLMTHYKVGGKTPVNKHKNMVGAKKR